MSDVSKADQAQGYSDEDLQDLVSSTDTGGRAPTNRTVALFLAGVALCWSLFQLWIAQPQLWFGAWIPVLNSSQTRPVHLGFAILLAFLAYPALKSSPRNRIPMLDWALAIVGAGCAFYVFLFSRELAETARSGLPTTPQIVIGSIGIVLLLEASRRALGPALTIVGSIFLAYAYMGTGWLIPDIIEHSGLSFTAIVNAQWLDTTGVFGIPLGGFSCTLSFPDDVGLGSNFANRALAWPLFMFRSFSTTWANSLSACSCRNKRGCSPAML